MSDENMTEEALKVRELGDLVGSLDLGAYPQHPLINILREKTASMKTVMEDAKKKEFQSEFQKEKYIGRELSTLEISTADKDYRFNVEDLFSVWHYAMGHLPDDIAFRNKLAEAIILDYAFPQKFAEAPRVFLDTGKLPTNVQSDKESLGFIEDRISQLNAAIGFTYRCYSQFVSGDSNPANLQRSEEYYKELVGNEKTPKERRSDAQEMLRRFNSDKGLEVAKTLSSVYYHFSCGLSNLSRQMNGVQKSSPK